MSFQVIAGKDAKAAEPGKACYVFSFPSSVSDKPLFQHRLPIVQAH